MGHSTEIEGTAGSSEGTVNYGTQGDDSIQTPSEPSTPAVVEVGEWLVWDNVQWEGWYAKSFPSYAQAKRHYDNLRSDGVMLTLTYHEK